MKSITFLMHNIYAMGGTVKSVTQLANTLAEKGHAVTIISVFRGSKQPYFELDPRIQIRNLTDYRPDPRNFKDIFINRLHKYTGFSKTKWLSSHEPGLSQFNHHVEKKSLKPFVPRTLMYWSARAQAITSSSLNTVRSTLKK